MNDISKNEEVLNFQNVALSMILPDGEIIYINKIEGLNNHIEYLIELSFHNSYVHSILKDLDLEYYKENPNKVSLEIFPLFQRDGCFIFASLSPNICLPTTWAIFYLSDSITLEQKDSMNRVKEKYKEMVFLDISKFDREELKNDTYLEDNIVGTPNYEMLYEILEKLEENNVLKK